MVEPEASTALAVGSSLSCLGATAQVVRTFRAARRALDKADASFDAAVVNLQLPDGRGAALVDRLRQTTHPCFCIMLADRRDPAVVRALLESGALDFLFQPFPSDVLMHALCRAVEATFTLRSRLASHSGWGMGSRSSASTPLPPAREPVHQSGLPARPTSAIPRERAVDNAVCKMAAGAGLSPKECAVLRYIAMGFRYTEIGEELSISPRTVKMHAAAVRRKVGVTTRHELLQKVFAV